ncbi:hypothetical protein H2200_001410 [Cladophialophora chaetospira]|uniref:Myb-like DNA-binding domain-containing protein n=1 Tax=Cladophialophora chaetospira TaxID=386627 RepID=A0AA38XLL1_9EURO|nr:hypothetical protein H2200_001410 [Cladophialophora chaetospira]
MSIPTSDDKIAYLLTVLKHTSLAKPDYAGIAVEAGINTASNAQRQYRSIIKGAGFDLVNDQIVGPDGTTGGGERVASPAKKPRAKKSPAKKATNDETPTKKRKLSESVVDSASDEDDDKQVKEDEAEAGDDVKIEEDGEGGTSGEN